MTKFLLHDIFAAQNVVIMRKNQRRMNFCEWLITIYIDMWCEEQRIYIDDYNNFYEWDIAIYINWKFLNIVWPYAHLR